MQTVMRTKNIKYISNGLSLMLEIDPKTTKRIKRARTSIEGNPFNLLNYDKYSEKIFHSYLVVSG